MCGQILAIVVCELSLANARENLRVNSGERSEADYSQMLQYFIFSVLLYTDVAKVAMIPRKVM